MKNIEVCENKDARSASMTAQSANLKKTEPVFFEEEEQGSGRRFAGLKAKRSIADFATTR